MSSCQIVAVDLGTSRIKAAVINEKGNFICQDSLRLRRTDSPTLQDAAEWIEITYRLLKSVVSRADVHPDGICLTGNMHALLCVDKQGMPLQKAILWSDNSAEKNAHFLNQRFGDFLKEETGNIAIPVFTLPKLLKLRDENPELYKNTHKILQSKDFLAYHLTGNFVTDKSDASGTQLFSLKNSNWSDALLKELQIPKEKLPTILESTEICGYISKTAAAQTGLQQGLPVIIGSGDLISAAIGSNVDENTFSLTLGTAGQLLAVGKKGNSSKLAGKLFVFAHAESEYDLFLGSVPSGGFTFEWLSAVHNISTEQFFKYASEAEIQDDLPIFLPYLLGKGAPSMDYRANASWHGLQAKHGIKEMCLGAVIGTLCPLRFCADILEQSCGIRTSVLLQATACREIAVRNAACALFRQQKFIPDESEASLLGTAVMGFSGIKYYPSIRKGMAEMIHSHPIHFPENPIMQQIYNRFLQITRSGIK